MTEIIVKLKLRDDPEFMAKCLLLLYERQLEDEQQTRDSHHENRMGFNKPDAPVLTPVAVALKDGEALTDAMIRIMAQRLPKYAKQLSAIIQED